MLRAAFLALLSALLLAACGEAARGSADDMRAAGTGGPALWEIRRGEMLEGWLFGSIHALPEDVRWRTPALDKAFQQSDLLVLEIDEYDGSFDRRAALDRLAFTRGLPLPSQRIAKQDRAALKAAFAEAGLAERDFADVESWAVALSLSSALSAAMSDADPALGIDRALYREARSRSGYPIVALEGAERQLAIFDRLPRAAQIALLKGVADEAQRQNEAGRRIDSWQVGDLTALQSEIANGYMAEPALRAALLDDRNRDWVPQITALLMQEPKPFIAVGTGHMLGDAALQTLLQRQGYSLRRVQ